MTDKTFLAGGRNSVYSAKNWTPAGVPQPGDTLTLSQGTATMAGGDLAGDTLMLKPGVDASGTVRVNLFDHGILTALETAPGGLPPTSLSADFAVAQHSTLVLTEISQMSSTLNARVQLVGGSTLDLTQNTAAKSSEALAMIDVFGHDTLKLTSIASIEVKYTTINLATPNSVLFMPSAQAGAAMDVEGSGQLALSGTENLLDATINSDVIGVATVPIDFSSSLTFGAAVGAGITIAMGSTAAATDAALVLNDSHRFSGIVDYNDQGKVSLTDLVDAASYDYNPSKDILSFYKADGSVTERLRLAAGGNHIKVYDSGEGGVYIAGTTNPGNGVALPSHTHC